MKSSLLCYTRIFVPVSSAEFPKLNICTSVIEYLERWKVKTSNLFLKELFQCLGRNFCLIDSRLKISSRFVLLT